MRGEAQLEVELVFARDEFDLGDGASQPGADRLHVVEGGLEIGERVAPFTVGEDRAVKLDEESVMAKLEVLLDPAIHKAAGCFGLGNAPV